MEVDRPLKKNKQIQHRTTIPSFLCRLVEFKSSTDGEKEKQN